MYNVYHWFISLESIGLVVGPQYLAILGLQVPRGLVRVEVPPQAAAQPRYPLVPGGHALVTVQYSAVQYSTLLTVGDEGVVGDLSSESIPAFFQELPTLGHNLNSSDLDFWLNSTPF